MKARTIIPLAIATVVTGAVGINKIVDSIGETNSLARDYAVVKANLTPREIQNYRFWSEATGQSILPHNGAANVFWGSSERTPFGFRPRSIGKFLASDYDGDGNLDWFDDVTWENHQFPGLRPSRIKKGYGALR